MMTWLPSSNRLVGLRHTDGSDPPDEEDKIFECKVDQKRLQKNQKFNGGNSRPQQDERSQSSMQAKKAGQVRKTQVTYKSS